MCLMCFIGLKCHAHDNRSPVQNMSHLLAELKSNPDDVAALIEASETYLDLCDYDGAQRMAHRLETVSHTSPDSVKALFYSRLLSGRASLMAGHGNEGVRSITDAYQIADRHEMMAAKALAGGMMGYCYVNLDLNFALGLEYYNTALAEARAIGDQRLVIDILNYITEAYLWNHDFSGVKFSVEALKLSREYGYDYGVLMSLLNLVHCQTFHWRGIGELPSMLREVESLQNKYGYVPQGEIDLVKGRLAMVNDDKERAVLIFSQALDDGAPVMPPLLRIKMLMYYSWALIGQEKYHEAIDVSKEALELVDKTGYNSFRISLLSSISYCYEHLGDYSEAFAYLKGYQTRMDSMWIARQAHNLNKMRVANEVQLNESTLSRQQNMLKTRQAYIIVLTVIGIILAGGVVMMWWLYRRKERLICVVVEREQESLLREKLLRQSLDQARAEWSKATEKVVSQPSLSEDKMEDLMMRFNELMAEKKVYTDSSVSIKSLADALDTNRTYLSNAINHTFGKSFPQVLAEYRVRAAIEMMSDPTCTLPLKAIASEVGFSSASVFFTTFRNVVGMTPAAYRSSISR